MLQPRPGFFPVDAETIRYMELTGRPEVVIERTEAYMREQGLFRDSSTPDPEFTDTLELDLGGVVPSLAGPKRPQDRVPMAELKESFKKALTAPVKERGFDLKPEAVEREMTFGTNGGSMKRCASSRRPASRPSPRSCRA